MVIVSPRKDRVYGFGTPSNNMAEIYGLLNGGDPKHLLSGMILKVWGK